MKFEEDEVTVLAGVRHGLTLGGPIAIEIGNTEWPKWETVMASDPVDPPSCDSAARNAPLTRPRPGHADYAGMLKYGFDDARPVLERASARETAARVAAGTIARAFLRQALGVEVVSHVISIGASKPYDGPPPRPADLAAIDDSPVRAFDKDAEAADDRRDRGGQEGRRHPRRRRRGGRRRTARSDWARSPAVTTGSTASSPRAVMGIQAIKGVEIGDGFETARRRGSVAHDEMYPGPDGVMRSTNRAGGLEGGMTNGQPLRVRAAMKPISTVPRALATVDMATGDEAVAIHQRSDVCAVPAAGVVVETMVALVLARAALEKFGGDSLTETRANVDGYLRAVAAPLPPPMPGGAGRRADGAQSGAGGHARFGQVHDRPAAGQGARTCRCSTPTPRSWRPPAAASPTSSPDGEPEFRRIEADVVRAALAEHDGVVSLGGGAVTTAEVREALAGHTVDLPGNQCRRRAFGVPPAAPRGRCWPATIPARSSATLMAQRVPLYREVATMRVNTNRRNPGAVVRHIVARLEDCGADPTAPAAPTGVAALPTVLNPAPTTEAPPDAPRRWPAERKRAMTEPVDRRRPTSTGRTR